MSERPFHPSLPGPPRSNGWLRPELISSWTEFVIIAALLLVLPIRNSTVAALGGSSGHFMQMLLSNDRLLWAVYGESLLLGFFLLYLRWRGWTPADLRIGLGWGTSAQGILLLIATESAVVLTVFGLMGVVYRLQTAYHTYLSFLLAMSPHIAPHSIHLSWPVIFVAMILNAFLEEIICMGYIFNQLAARWGPAAALGVTVFLRVACHTYQDPIHLVGIGVLFSIYGVWYWQTRQLWPLIFAHLLLDIISMSAVKVMFG
jgi:membrane protease YdiL (CAAX protease family)